MDGKGPARTSLEVSGRWSYRVRSFASLLWSSWTVSVSRALHGPHLPGWTWSFEVATSFERAQGEAAFAKSSIADGRECLDALVLQAPLTRAGPVEDIAQTHPVKGHWYTPGQIRHATLLYLHGGGYAYDAKAHRNFAALIAASAQARTFALDYRLSPEHAFPAQLDDALAAYHWLLGTGIPPEHLVVIGDSAGGNLTLALLLALRDQRQPLPALAICLCPWTDLTNAGKSMTENERHDWVTKRMADQWAAWFCGGRDPRDPLISPIGADLHGLCPLYIQAGTAEILYDMIVAFVDQARCQGCDVTFDAWEHMNHDFQAYGRILPQSQEALGKIAALVRRYGA